MRDDKRIPYPKRSKRRLSKAEARHVLKTYGGRCFMCLWEAERDGEHATLPIDSYVEEAHFRAWSQGGDTDPSNIFLLCPAHHRTFDHTDERMRLRFALDEFHDRTDTQLSLPDYERLAIRTAIHAPPRSGLRHEIWMTKARFPHGPSLLAEEAELFLAQGKAAEAWSAARAILRATKPDDDLERAGAFSVAAQAAQMFGDLDLAVALTSEALQHLDRTQLSGRHKVLLRTKRTTELANHVMTTSREPGRFAAFDVLDGLKGDLRGIGRLGEQTAVHLDAFIHARDLARWRKTPRRMRGPATKLVKESEQIAKRTLGQGPLAETRRELNVAHTLFDVGGFDEASQLLIKGANALRSIGDCWNAALTGFQAAEAVLRGTPATDNDATRTARDLIRQSLHDSISVRNADVYWTHLLEAAAALGIYAATPDGGSAPLSLGRLVERRVSTGSRELRDIQNARNGIRLNPRPHSYFMSNITETVRRRLA